jgi:uncharacterized protein (TIGR02117 family)
MKFVRRVITGIVAAIALIALAIGIGGVPLPAAGWDINGGGKTVRIYVLSNGFHSDIAVPRDFVETYLPVDPADYPVATEAIEYYAIGWGSKTAYTSLRAVSDLTPGIIAKAFAFNETVVHVLPIGALAPSERVFAYDIRVSDLVVLMLDMSRFFGSPQPLEDMTQGFGDRFYPGLGRFAPWSSCNSWTGRRLRSIGIGVGLWTVTAQTLEFGLRRTSIAGE